MTNIFNAPSGTAFDKNGTVIEPAAPAAVIETPAIVDAPPVPAADTAPALPEPTPNEIDWASALSERTGGKFKSWEELNSRLDTPAEITYANDESKRIAEYLKAGKVDDVLQVYNEQRLLGSVKDMEADDVIKLAMSYKQPAFSQQEVNEEFASRFSIEKPEEPVQDEYLDEDAFALAKKAYKKELDQYTKQEKALAREMKSEAAAAREYLASLQKDIVLPDIQPANNIAPADPEAAEEARKAWETGRNAYLSSLQKSAAEFNEIPIEITDEGFSFKGSYQIDPAEKAQLSKDLTEKDVVNDLLLSRYDNNGEYNTKQLMDDIYWLNNKNKILASAVKQAVAQDRLDALRQTKNIDLTGQRQDAVPSKEAALSEFSKAFLSAR